MSFQASSDPASRWWARRVEESVHRDGYLRRSPFAVGGEGDHKEWLHFVVHTPDVDLLVNFSLVDDVRPEARPGAEVARIVVLTRTRGGSWDGAVERFAPREVSVRGGEVDLRFGANAVRFRDGAFELRVALRERPISIALRMKPLVMPAHFNNVRLEAADRPIHWILLPRLEAEGEACIAGETFRFRGAPAYHDHDWGHFHWGRDFAWEWGYSLPTESSNPWSLVFVRMSDRGRHRAYTQALFLWKGARHQRIFRDHELSIASQGFLRVPRVFKLPPVMSLLSPGSAADVPARLEVSAQGRSDEVSFVFESEDVGQVCIPDDVDDDGVTTINEVTGQLRLEGRVRGETVRIESWAMFEFVRGE